MVLLSAGGLSISAAAENKTIAGEFIVEPATLHCLGFEWLIEGDDNRNGHVAVTYRAKGAPQWREAQPLLRIYHEVVYPGDKNQYICGNLYAGSIMFLEPDTEYEARFVLSDPDGGNVAKTVIVKTRAEPKTFSAGKTLHVYSAGFSGKKELPGFPSILAAYGEAQAGDIILIHAGTYQEDFVFTKSGTAEKPIVFRGAGDGEAVLLGSKKDFMMDVHKADYLWFENLTIRDPGTGDGALITRSGVALYAGAVGHGNPGCQGLVVRCCKFEDVGTGIMASDANCRNFYIADNIFLGRNPTWEHRKRDPKYQHSGMAIWIGGQGQVICHNRITDFWDGIDITAGGAYPLESRDRKDRICAIDIYNNDIANCMDDFMETDHASHNIRVWENRGFNSSACGLSAQPVYGGPVYFVRNLLYNVQFNGGSDGAFKFNCGPAGVMVYHNTVAGSLTRPSGASDFHLRNNLLMRPMDSGTATNDFVTTLDYNGYRPEEGQPLFRWSGPKSASCKTLKEVYERLGFEEHGRLVDYDVFVNAQVPFYRKGYKYGPEENKLLEQQVRSGIKTPAWRRMYVPEDMDFRLKPGSVAADAGVALANINDGFTGKAPDLGAYEQGKPIPIYGPRPAP